MRPVRRVCSSDLTSKVHVASKLMPTAPFFPPPCPYTMRSGFTTSLKTLWLGYSVPSGPRMVCRQWPPGRTSISWMVVVKPLGPHHCATCLGSVNASQTISRGASYTRDVTISRSDATVAGLFLSLIAGMLLLLMNSFCFQRAQIVVEPVEALLPELAIVLHPLMHFLEGGGLQPARTPLRFASVGDQPGALQHFQVLGDGRHAHVERLGQFCD